MKTKQVRLDAIRKEIDEAEKVIRFLQPAPNRDRSELEIRREAMRRIDRYLESPNEKAMEKETEEDAS